MNPENGKIYAVSGKSMARLLQENQIRKALGELSLIELRDVKAMVVIDPSEASVGVSKTAKLTAVVLPEGSTVTWASSDATKATVDAGVVTGVAKGSCVVSATITVGGETYKDVCNVTVA